MSGAIHLGNLLIEPDLYRVQVGQHTVSLTYAQFRLLALLASQPNRVWSRRELMAALEVGNSEVKGLSTHISRLRKKLAGSEPYTITTVTKRGYALTRGEPEGSVQARTSGGEVVCDC